MSPRNDLTALPAGAANALFAAFVLILVLAVWALAVAVLSVPDYLVPAPGQVVMTFVRAPDYFLLASLYTLAEAAAGFCLALVVGLVVGIFAILLTRLTGLAIAVAGALQTLPIVAVAPLIILWFGQGFWSKTVMAALVAVAPIIVAAIRGLQSPPRDLVVSLTLMGCRKSDVLMSVTLPYATRHIAVGMQIAASLAVIGAIVAEYTGSLNGIGYVIMQSSYRMDTPGLFCAVVLSIVCGVIIVQASRLLSVLMSSILNELQVSAV